MDRNEIIVNGKVARVKLYDARCNHIATAIIDADDVDKIRYTKWKIIRKRIRHERTKVSGSNKHMHRKVLGT